MNQKDYTIRIALASLLVIAMALPIGLFTLQESTRLDSQATSRQRVDQSTRLPGELLVTPALTQQKSGFNNCRVGGCNGELCADPATGPLESVCIYKEEFACYRNALCELQSDGRCGWTLTDQLRACLGEHTGQPAIPPSSPPANAQDSSCTPRPACLDSNPRCLLAEPENGWCPPDGDSQTESPTSPTSTLTNQPTQITCDLACPDSFILTPDCQCLPPERPQQAINPDTVGPPSLNPSTLPMAINRQYYLTQIQLTSPLEHSRLEVTVTGLPSGLALTDCTPTSISFNRHFSTCTLSGMIDTPARTYPLVFAISDGLGNTAIETRDLQVISQQSWLDRLFTRLRLLPL
jgi:hypothetical protein